MKKNIFQKIQGKWTFLIIAVFLYIILFLFNFSLAIKTFFVFLGLLEKIIPVLFLVFLFMFFFAIFFNPKKMTRSLGKNAGARGWLISIVAGILSSGPTYVWYPLLKDLKEKGMRNSFIVAFLYNRAIKLPLLPIMVYYFGLKLVLVLTFYMILFSIINGLLLEKILKFKID